MLNNRQLKNGPPGDVARVRMLPDYLQNEERLRFLTHELCHRNKNLLAVVQAIANQIASRSASLAAFKVDFSERLQGLSRSLDLLVEDAHGAWIADLVRSQVEPFAKVDGVRIATTGAPFYLDADAAQSIGLALHELATNAVKHGALSIPGGIVTVRWDVTTDDSEGRFRLQWFERNGPKVAAPTHQGFGTVVLQRMAGQAMKGKVDHRYDELGVSWVLEVPVGAVEGPKVLRQPHRPARQLFGYIPRLFRSLTEA